MKKIFRNKKGDIAITLLVVGVFAVCSLALLTFFISDFKVGNSFVGIDKVHKLNSDLDAYEFYKSEGISEESLNTIFRDSILEKNEKKYFYQEKSYSKFSFTKFKQEEVLLFSVQYEIPS